MDAPSDNLQVHALLSDYAAGRRDPLGTLRALHRRAESLQSRNIWITLLDWAQIERHWASALAARDAGKSVPLLGVPFAIKDNIDLEGVVTSAACPSFGSKAERSATVVERLLAAGAIPLGKTNLDQFATGLVGTRSPYGACSSAFDERYISGGSSSGSALAVALGLVSFALGTDTAGSGRVPAALNNVVGLKPTPGLLSTRGVVPACRSLDCVSVFAGSVADCLTVLSACAGYDPEDSLSRGTAASCGRIEAPFRFGIPAKPEFFQDADAARCFADAIARLQTLGGTPVEVDFAPFHEAASLLYHGPWVAERFAAVGQFVSEAHGGLDPVVQSIIEGGARFSAVDAFRARYRLHELQRQVQQLWQELDVLVVPTTPTTYTLAQIAESPVELNSRLGTYTNFTNLLDLCGVAVPTGFKKAHLPFGVTLLGPAFCDLPVAALAERLHHTGTGPSLQVGATDVRVDEPKPLGAQKPSLPSPARARQSTLLAVVGAHLQGQPLHSQLVELGARFEGERQTAPCYRLYALQNTRPAKPGLVRVPSGGQAIALELYALDPAAFGKFVQEVPEPLVIGNVQLQDGRWVKGFLCEPLALTEATDITAHGGWRRYLAHLAKPAK